MQNFRKLYVVIIAYKNENNNRKKSNNNTQNSLHTQRKKEWIENTLMVHTIVLHTKNMKMKQKKIRKINKKKKKKKKHKSSWENWQIIEINCSNIICFFFSSKIVHIQPFPIKIHFTFRFLLWNWSEMFVCKNQFDRTNTVNCYTFCILKWMSNDRNNKINKTNITFWTEFKRVM